jgi:hypothetical protein
MLSWYNGLELGDILSLQLIFFWTSIYSDCVSWLAFASTIPLNYTVFYTRRLSRVLSCWSAL